MGEGLERPVLVISTPLAVVGAGLESYMREQYPELEIAQVRLPEDLRAPRRWAGTVRAVLLSASYGYRIARLVRQAQREWPEASVLGISDGPYGVGTRQLMDGWLDLTMGRQEVVSVVSAHLFRFKRGAGGAVSVSLSSREEEVLKLLASGLTAREIGARLFISEHTVVTHRKKISTKLGIKSISGLTIYAASRGLVEG